MADIIERVDSNTCKTREERLHELLYSNDDRQELAEYIMALEDELVTHAKKVDDCHKLVFDCLTTICGWTMTINEHKGYDKLDATTPPAQTFIELRARARKLGVEDV